MTSDAQGPAEALDDDELPAEYPPQRETAVDAYGITANEERAGESLGQALGRENPQVSVTDLSTDDRARDQLVDDGSVVDPMPADEQDMAQEHEGTVPAEEAAMHVEQL